MKYLLPMFCIVLTGCYYDHASELYPNSTNCIEQPNASFSVTVLPLLTKRCNNCHGGSSPSAGIDLTTYSHVIKYVNDGSLVGSINQTSGYSAMPKNSGKMPACEINNIQNWITTGALNN